MTARLRAGLVAATLMAAALSACGDPNEPIARFATYADTLELYALNGAPRGAPTALRLLAGVGFGAAVPTDASLQFDVAVDIDAQGRPVLYPIRAVAAPFLGRHRVGIQKTDRGFDSIVEAPTSGYTHDSVTVVTVGQVLLLESADPDACSVFLGGGVIYAKMVVDSIRTDTRRLYVRVTGDPNCGFRSLVPGVPED
ncbi:MAG: hypothetical protein ABR499_06965 [Gemmatimonadaceae bacterium]